MSLGIDHYYPKHQLGLSVAVEVMTIYSHNKTMKEVMVSQLKAKLSAYLALVRRGETVIVRDRQTPIARLVPYLHSADELQLDGATRTASELKELSPVRLLKPVDVVEALREDRAAR